MWQRFQASSSWQTLSSEERGASAILLVMGIALLLLISGATVMGQAKYELQMSAAQSDAEQAQMLILGAFNDAMKRAETTTWPSVAYVGETESCVNYLTGVYPRYCIDAQARPTGTGILSIPIRIGYQMSERSNTEYAYGWILFNGTLPSKPVTGFRYWHTWCTYETDSYLRANYGPCVQGG